MARREGGEWLSSPTYSVATGVSASTLLPVLYEHVTYGGSSTRITGAYGPCDAEGYGVSALVSSWRNRVSSLKGFNRQRQDRLHHHVPAVTCKPLALNLAVQGMPMVRRITTVGPSRW